MWLNQLSQWLNPDEKCDSSNKSFVLSCGAVYYAEQGGSSF